MSLPFFKAAIPSLQLLFDQFKLKEIFKMRCVAIIVLVCASVASGFRATIPRVAVRSINRLQMSEKTDLVPLDKTNIENAAAVSGGIVGFAIGGPVFGIFLAAASNYVSKKEDSDYGSALRGFGKTVIESYNFLTTLNNKNDITGSASSSFDKFITNAEIESEGFGKFTKASDKFVSKVKDFNTEYDLLGKGKQAIIAGSALTDAALERIEELNAKYDFIESTKKAANSAVEVVKKQTSSTD